MKAKHYFFPILFFILLINCTGAYYSTEPILDERFDNYNFPHEYYNSIAKENPSNHQVCEKETSLHLKDMCLQAFALETKNPDICDLMNDDNFKESCYKYTGFKLNSYWIKNILIYILGLTVLLFVYLFLIFRVKSWSYVKKGVWIGGITGMMIFVIGFMRESGFAIFDLRSLGFGPCFFITQCQGEACMSCLILGPFINIILGSILGFSIGWLIRKIKSK